MAGHAVWRDGSALSLYYKAVTGNAQTMNPEGSDKALFTGIGRGPDLAYRP